MRKYKRHFDGDANDVSVGGNVDVLMKLSWRLFWRDGSETVISHALLIDAPCSSLHSLPQPVHIRFTSHSL